MIIGYSSCSSKNNNVHKAEPRSTRFANFTVSAHSYEPTSNPRTMLIPGPSSISEATASDRTSALEESLDAPKLRALETPDF